MVESELLNIFIYFHSSCIDFKTCAEGLKTRDRVQQNKTRQYFYTISRRCWMKAVVVLCFCVVLMLVAVCLHLLYFSFAVPYCYTDDLKVVRRVVLHSHPTALHLDEKSCHILISGSLVALDLSL